VIAIGSVGVAQAFRGEDESVAGSLSLAPLLDHVARGEFDLIALGRVLLSDPAWPTKVREGRLGEIRAYDKADEAQLT
jgi:2,4-dienoyl-CoA reductase-like NADH-dependent reductase (Old Yellow Enzyme family)